MASPFDNANPLRQPTIFDGTPSMPDVPYADSAGAGELGRGFSSALTSSVAAAHAAVGSALDYVGLRSPAMSQYQSAREGTQRAAVQAPFVEHLGGIQGLRDVPKYVAGKVGEGAALLAPAIATGAAGAAVGIPGVLGAALPMFPLGVGESVLPHIKEDNTLDKPVGDVLPTALAHGAIEAGLTGVAPGLAGEALAGRAAARSFGRGVLGGAARDAAIQGVAAPASLAATNAVEGTPTKTQDLLDAAAGGVAGIAPLAAAAHAVGGVKVKAPEPKPAPAPEVKPAPAAPAPEPITPKDSAPDWAAKLHPDNNPFPASDATEPGRAAQLLREGLTDIKPGEDLRTKRDEMNAVAADYATRMSTDERVPEETRARVAQAVQDGRVNEEWSTLANYADLLNKEAKDQEPAPKENLAGATQAIKDVGKKVNDALKAAKAKLGADEEPKFSHMDTSEQTNLRDYVFNHLKDEYKSDPDALKSARSAAYTLARLSALGDEPSARDAARATYHVLDDLVQDKGAFIKGLPTELKSALSSHPERVTRDANVGGSAFDTYIDKGLSNGQRMQVAKRFEEFMRGEVPDKYTKPAMDAFAAVMGGEKNVRALMDHYGDRYERKSEGVQKFDPNEEGVQLTEKDGPKPTFTYADDSGEPRGFTSRQGAFDKLEEMRKADPDFAKNHSVVSLREAADEHGGADALHKKVRADLEARAAQDEQHANEPVPGTSFTRGDRATSLRASMEDPRLLDKRYVIKSTDRDQNDLVATNADFKKMRTLDARKVRDPAAKQAIRDGSFQVELTNGKRLTVNSESVWKTMAAKRGSSGIEGDHAFVSQMFKDGVAAILARPEVKAVHGADRADLLIDRKLGLRFRNLSGSVEHGRAIAERNEQFARLDETLKTASKQDIADMRQRQEQVLNGPKDPIRKALAREVLERIDRQEARNEEDRRIESGFYDKREGMTDIVEERQKQEARSTKVREFEDTGDAVGELGKKGTPGALQAEPKNHTPDMFGGRAEGLEGRKPVEEAVKGEPRSDELMTRRMAEEAKQQRGLAKIERDVRAGKTDAIIARAEKSTNVDQMSRAMAHLQTAARSAKGQERAHLERVAGVLKNRVRDVVGERNAPSKVADLTARRGERLKARALEIARGMDDEDSDTLMNDRMSSPDKRTVLPKSMRDGFGEWLRDSYSAVEREELMAPDRQVETETKYLEELASGDIDGDPREVAMAKQILERGKAGPSLVRSEAHGTLESTVRTAHDVDPKLFQGRLQEAWKAVDDFVKDAKLDPNNGLSVILKSRLQALYKEVTGGGEPYTVGETLGEVTNLFHDAVTALPDGLETQRIYELINPLVDKMLRPLIPLTDEQFGALEKTIHDQLGEGVEVAVASVIKDEPLAGARSYSGSHGPAPFSGRERVSIGALIAAAFAPKGREFDNAQITAHHEVMHAALARIERQYGSGITKRLIDAAQQEHIRDQVLNAPESASAREYFTKNPEEMLVQAYGLWATGKLTLKSEPQLSGFFNRIKLATQALLRLLTGDKALAEVFGAVKRGELADRTPMTGKELADRVNAARARGDLKYSKERPGAAEMTKEQRAEVLREAGKILGPDQQVMFEKAFDWSGKYDPETDTIHISTLATDPSSVAWHEAVHALFAKLLDKESRTKLRAPLQRVADSGIMRRQLETLLKDHPDALEQIRTSEEERLAYMFQFHRAGLLRLGPETKNIFNRIMDFVRAITGTVSQWEQAGRYMDAIYDGKFSDPSKAALVIHDMKNETLGERVKRLAGPLTEAAEKLMEPTAGRLQDTHVPALRQLARLYHVTPNQEEGNKLGFLQERAQQQGKFENRVYDALKGVGAEQGRDLIRELRSGNVTSARARAVQGLLRDVFKYMQDAGVKRAVTDENGKVTGWADLKPRADYGMPQIWNRDAILRDPKKFVADMVAAGVAAKDASAIHDIIMKPNDHDAVNMRQVGFTPFNRSVNSREFHFTPEQLKAIEPYLDNDPVRLLTTYIHQATHRAEHTRIFSYDGSKAKALLDQAQKQGATPEELAMASKALQAMDGTLGADMDPKLRKIASGVVVYENVALLPFALFSSLVDPINAAARSGSWADARRAMVEGIKGLVTKQDDENYQMARTLGLISEANMLEKFGDLYNGMYMAKWLKGLNDKFFRYNGMESWNKSMRTAAMVSSERFMLKHTQRPDGHSERYLRELGVEKGDIKELSDGRIAKTQAQGLTPEQEERVQRAIFRFVDDAVLRPNSAHRPIWGSDPHYNVIFHLKQYSFSYHETFIKRAVHEADYGNYMPMWTLAAAVPFMDVVDTAQELLFGASAHHAAGGLMRAITRSGVLGTKNFALDAALDPAYGGVPGQSFLGPAVNHAIYGAQTLAGKRSPESFFFRSIPAGGLVHGLAS